MAKGDVSPRQKEVGVLIASGLETPEIAVRLGISRGTVTALRRQLYARLNVHNGVQLTHYAIAHGWVKVEGARGRPRKEMD